MKQQRTQARTSNPYKHIKRTATKRSGLETEIARALISEIGFDFEEEWELDAIEYAQNKSHKYHPDFRLANGIYIEAKGWFKTADRQKHLAIKYQHPALDIRFVFSNPKSKIGKQSATTYAMWCDKNGFKYAKGTVPESWLREPRQTTS